MLHLADPAFSSDPRAHPHFPLPLPLSPPPPLPTTALTPRRFLPRKGTMRALVRRLANRHNLDRIDELDETDPFGANYHHDGPYEAIAITHAKPASRPNVREHVPRPLQSARHHVPPLHGQEGLSLHLEPGQILQHNTIYTSLAANVSNPQSNTVQSEHSRSRSLPNAWSHSRHDHPNDLHKSAPRPLERHPVNSTPKIYHDPNVAPHVLSQSDMTILPPPRYESRLHNSAPSRSIQRPPVNRTPRKTQAAERVTSPHDLRDKSIHSSDSSTTASTTTRSSSSSLDKSSEPPRIHHLPKRIVMPSPLQPRPQHNPPASGPAASQDDDYPDRLSLESAEFKGQPAVCSQGPKLLQKKSSAFPDNIPILQDDVVPIKGNTRSKTANEAEGTREKIRRRRLSKRKNDV